ncbi:MAG: bifunctional ornithine acetyltransferase/N-acetylglutamate synthase [Chromatiales bacterium]|nr:bifunctional ornithine acetyltransferase/N-acetylglutamate synthase [Chromatiales bacterium]
MTVCARNTSDSRRRTRAGDQHRLRQCRNRPRRAGRRRMRPVPRRPRLLGCPPQAVLPFSTGVIVRASAGRSGWWPGCRRRSRRSAEAGWSEAAHGIMTTDTLPKGASRRVLLGGKTVTVTGIAKGAGMIRPNMATMLGFVATDAAIAAGAAAARCWRSAADAQLQPHHHRRRHLDQRRLRAAWPPARRPAPCIDAAHPRGLRVCARRCATWLAELAQAIVRDGEGATKFITMRRRGQGASEAECLQVAYAIAHSPLVKTAFFASDPNLGPHPGCGRPCPCRATSMSTGCRST